MSMSSWLFSEVCPVVRRGRNMIQGPIQRRFGPSCIFRVYFYVSLHSFISFICNIHTLRGS